jgi:uncharacterized protein (DUF302 family)
MNYGYKKQVIGSFGDTLIKTKEELKKEGFGILTEIDVKATMKEKLDLDYEQYTILGACNPKLAHQALEAEKEIGLFLPCNVIVYKEKDTVFVSAILPVAMMRIIGNPILDEVARVAEGKLKKIIDAL